MLKIEKAVPEVKPVRSGPSFSELQITGLPDGSIFPIPTNDPVIDYFLAVTFKLFISLNVYERYVLLCCVGHRWET